MRFAEALGAPSIDVLRTLPAEQLLRAGRNGTTHPIIDGYVLAKEPYEIFSSRQQHDIPLLIGYFLDKINREMGLQISGVSPEAQNLLEGHSWPGNVRELENTLIRAAVLSSGPILFPRDFTLQSKPAATTMEVDQLSLEEIIRHKLEDYFRRTQGVDVDNLYALVIERIERPLIELTLKKTKGNQIRAAQILGINRNTLRKKITDLRIELKKEPS